jgi:probable HAF family extracellular repeat protein
MNNMNKTLALALSAVLAAPLVASAEPVYTIRFLPEDFFGNAMNQAGHVVAPGQSGVLVWSEAGVKRVAGLDNGLADGRGINNRDDVAGTGSFQGNFGIAFANIGGVVHNIGAAAPDFGNSDGLAINDNNWVVGTLYGSIGIESRPYIYRNGNVQVLPTFGGNNGSAVAVSNRGYVTGWASLPKYGNNEERRRAFLYRNGKMTRLGTLPGDDRSVGQDVNDRGEVVGISSTTDGPGQHGFLYAHGKMVDLGSLGGAYTQARGINNVGVVVGLSHEVVGGFDRAMIYAFGKMLNLNTLVIPQPNWVLIAAFDINDAFQILAIACPADFNGQCRTVRLDPPPDTRKHRIPPFFLRLFGQERAPADEAS